MLYISICYMAETIKKYSLSVKLWLLLLRVDVCMDLHMYIWIYVGRFDRKS